MGGHVAPGSRDSGRASRIGAVSRSGLSDCGDLIGDVEATRFVDERVGRMGGCGVGLSSRMVPAWIGVSWWLGWKGRGLSRGVGRVGYGMSGQERKDSASRLEGGREVDAERVVS